MSLLRFPDWLAVGSFQTPRNRKAQIVIIVLNAADFFLGGRVSTASRWKPLPVKGHSADTVKKCVVFALGFLRYRRVPTFLDSFLLSDVRRFPSRLSGRRSRHF